MEIGTQIVYYFFFNSFEFHFNFKRSIIKFMVHSVGGAYYNIILNCYASRCLEDSLEARLRLQTALGTRTDGHPSRVTARVDSVSTRRGTFVWNRAGVRVTQFKAWH